MIAVIARNRRDRENQLEYLVGTPRIGMAEETWSGSLHYALEGDSEKEWFAALGMTGGEMTGGGVLWCGSVSCWAGAGV